jgi:hypothetical protein
LIVASLFSFLSPTHWLNVIAKDIGNGAVTALTDVGSFMANSSQLTFGQPSYIALYGDGMGLAILIGAGAILYGGAAAALSGDIKRLTSALARVVVAIMGSFALLTLVLMVQRAIFQVDQGIVLTFHHSEKQFGAAIAGMGSITVGVTAAIGPIVLILIALALLVGALAVYAVLLMTTAIAYITCFFAPLAWVVSAKAGKKAIELLVAMLLTPFVITCVIAVGLAITADGPSVTDHITHTLMGLGLLYVAIFAPLALMRFMPIAESHIANLRHPHQAAVGASNTAKGGWQTAQSVGSKAKGSAGAGAAGAAAGAAASTAGAAKSGADKATTEPMNDANATATPSQAPQGAPTGGGGGGSQGSSPHGGQSSPGGDQNPHSTEPHTRQANPPPNPAGGSGGGQP